MAEAYLKCIQFYDIYRSKYYNIYRQNAVLEEDVVQVVLYLCAKQH